MRAVQLRAAACDKSPYQQNERCAHDAPDEAGSLTSPIPANGLSEIGSHQCTGNSEDLKASFSLQLSAVGRNQFGNYASNEAD